MAVDTNAIVESLWKQFYLIQPRLDRNNHLLETTSAHQANLIEAMRHGRVRQVRGLVAAWQRDAMSFKIDSPDLAAKPAMASNIAAALADGISYADNHIAFNADIDCEGREWRDVRFSVDSHGNVYAERLDRHPHENGGHVCLGGTGQIVLQQLWSLADWLAIRATIVFRLSTWYPADAYRPLRSGHCVACRAECSAVPLDTTRFNSPRQCGCGRWGCLNCVSPTCYYCRKYCPRCGTIGSAPDKCIHCVPKLFARRVAAMQRRLKILGEKILTETPSRPQRAVFLCEATKYADAYARGQQKDRPAYYLSYQRNLKRISQCS